MKIKANGITFNVTVSGPETATPVVLHHPLATNLTCWDELTAALDKSYRVVRFDARGHGQTESPKGPYTFETLAQDVVGLMDELRVRKAHFLGLSMGGMVGQYLGLLHAARFHTLTLVSTSSHTPPAGAALWDERIRNAGTLGMPSVVDGAMARWVAPKVLTERPALVDRLKTMIVTTPPVGYVGWCEAIRHLDVTARLKAITLPTCVIVGALDPATPPAAAEVIHNEIKGSELVVMPGVSHMLHNEDPAAFAGHVAAFLSKHPAKA
jgi:3-oxoadipate enol-lactonase